MNGRLLCIPEKVDEERDALALCWEQQGGQVMRIDKFWVKPDIGTKAVSLYGFDMFCLILAQILEVELISPPDDLLLHIDAKRWLKRNLQVRALGDVRQEDPPIFIKSLVPKLFPAKVYTTLQELHSATEGIKPDEEVLLSSIISVEKEVRVFVVVDSICDMALYEGEGSAEEAREFALTFLEHCRSQLPQPTSPHCGDGLRL